MRYKSKRNRECKIEIDRDTEQNHEEKNLHNQDCFRCYITRIIFFLLVAWSYIVYRIIELIRFLYST